MKLRWRFGLLLFYPIFKLSLGLKVKGKEQLRQVGGKIIAVNHTSNFDPVLVGFAIRRELWFLAKEELFNFRKWFSWLIRTWNAYPLKRGTVGPGLFKTCSQLLQKNKTLIMFPEGTRNRNDTLLPFKPGLGLLAIANSVPVVPCHIYNIGNSFISKIVDPDINPGKIRLGDFFSSRITIKFGNPIPPNGFSKNRNDYEKFANKIRIAVAQLSNE
jgi:1-acyl-sn-glycerol-3-phosphate acyltransferase